MWSSGSRHSTIIRSIIELNWCPVSAGQPRLFSIFLHESPPQLLQADQFHPTKTHVVDSEPNTSVSHFVFLLKYPDFWAAGLSIWDLF